MAKKPLKPFSFETAIAELEGIVSMLEKGDISLEESLKNFERGIELTRNCQQALQEAEQKVKILTQIDGEPSLQSFESED